MQKSFIDRLFPQSSPLPQYERSPRRPPSTLSSPASSPVRPPSLHTKPRQSSPLARSSLSPQPSAPPALHYDDPMLPINRTAKSLQRHIQKLLDAQAEGLLEGIEKGDGADVSSAGSLTPTPTVSSPRPRSITTPKVLPVRQPAETTISLRQARRGLRKAMEEFVNIKTEELTVLDVQYSSRENALAQTAAFGSKKSSLENEIKSMREGDGASAHAEEIRQEAGELESTIRELEDKLLEMKAQHRRLLDQATQLENSVDSKLSSYKSSIAMADMEIRKFLRHPPISHRLSDNIVGEEVPGMYDLRPERRTLDMARDQWTSEQGVLSHRKKEVENEQQALEDGAKVWTGAVKLITAFERDLRVQMRGLVQASPEDGQIRTEKLLADLDALVGVLEKDLSTAETKHWNLLICALGAEVEALRQGRSILQQALGRDELDTSSGTGDTNGHLLVDQDNDQTDSARPESRDSNSSAPVFFTPQPPGFENHWTSTTDHENIHEPATSPDTASNKSLEDTLQEFGDNQQFPSQSQPQPNLPPSTANTLIPDPTTMTSSKSTIKQSSQAPQQFPEQKHARTTSTSTSAAPNPDHSNAKSEKEDRLNALDFGFGPAPTRVDQKGRRSQEESEDDEPGPDFWISH